MLDTEYSNAVSSVVMDAIKRACEVVGGRAALAEAIGVTPSFISQLVNGERPIPAERVLAIEHATGGKVTRYQLRPDVFGKAA